MFTDKAVRPSYKKLILTRLLGEYKSLAFNGLEGT